MQNSEPMCYITYAVPARLMPELPLGNISVPIPMECKEKEEEAPALYPPGFMPDWFLRGSFPEDDFDD